MSITIEVTSSRSGMKRDLVVIELAYRLAKDDRVRLVPAPGPLDAHGLPLPHPTGGQPVVLLDEPMLANVGPFSCGTEAAGLADAQALIGSSYPLMKRLRASTPGTTLLVGRPRPYRLTDAELARYDGATLRLAWEWMDVLW